MELLKEDDILLRRKAKRVDKIDDTVRNIAANMIRTMIENNGIGLAANQVGILKQIIVVLVNDEPRVMINPEILDFSKDDCIINEGCLSFPQQFYDIQRPEKVKVKYRCLSGKPMIEWYEGIEARCILHEIDHIKGIVFTEKVNG
jgi:peptide deformylase